MAWDMQLTSAMACSYPPRLIRNASNMKAMGLNVRKCRKVYNLIPQSLSYIPDHFAQDTMALIKILILANQRDENGLKKSQFTGIGTYSAHKDRLWRLCLLAPD